MCSGGGGGGSYTPAKVDPAPTTVTSADVGTDTLQKKQKSKHNRAANAVARDRGTILGSLGDGDSNTNSTLG